MCIYKGYFVVEKLLINQTNKQNKINKIFVQIKQALAV